MIIMVVVSLAIKRGNGPFIQEALERRQLLNLCMKQDWKLPSGPPSFPRYGSWCAKELQDS